MKILIYLLKLTEIFHHFKILMYCTHVSHTQYDHNQKCHMEEM